MHAAAPLHDCRDAPGDRRAVIDQLHHPAARRVADVLRRRAPEPGTILIDDLENIEQAVRCGVRIDSVYLSEDLDLAVLGDSVAADRGVPVYRLAREEVDALFGAEKRARVFALAEAPRAARLGDLADAGGDIVVLDGVRLAGNIGAVTRTSAGFAAAGLVLLDSGLRNVVDRRLIRASRGLVFALPVVIATLDEFAEYVRRERIPVATLAAHAPEQLESASEVVGRLALVLGSERHGVSQRLEELAAHLYAIPMSPGMESLNVSVSAGIALYERGRAARPR